MYIILTSNEKRKLFYITKEILNIPHKVRNR